MRLLELLNPGWVGALIGVGGTIVALVLYRISAIGARPAYQTRGIQLVGGNAELPEEVTIHFQGEAVSRLTKTEIVFWNAGRQLCRGVDVVSDDQVRCDFGSDATVLRVRVLKRTRRANKFLALTAPGGPNRVLLQFDYLDPGDGAVVEVLHTGEKRHPDVLGTIRGIPRGIVNLGRVRALDIFPSFTGHLVDRALQKARRLIPVFLLAGAVVLGGLAVSAPAVIVRTKTQRAFFLFFSGMYTIPAILRWKDRRRFPKTLQIDESDD
jgi:hypothetical protein